MTKHSLFEIFQLSLTLAVLVHAQDQSGFISIDCGLVDEPNYSDETTGINYTTDANIIDRGVSYNISSEYKSNSLPRQFWNVRSFPEGARNCYTFNVPRTNSNKRLIRMRFMYGNYDKKESLPRFDVYIGANRWDMVEFENASSLVSKEMVDIASSDYVHVCLVNTNSGVPFISALEIRILKNDTYLYQSEPLELLERFDVGLQEHQMIRYPNDVYDRIWTPYNSYNWKIISTSRSIGSPFFFEVPSIVQSTAVTPANESDNLRFSYSLNDEVALFYVALYFAEIQRLPSNQTRAFNIYVNGGPLLPVNLPFLGVAAEVYAPASRLESKIEIWINRTDASTVPPVLNAIEVYRRKVFNQPETDQNDVDSIMQIKSVYAIKRNWQGDPCFPQAYMWNGLNCSYSGLNQPRITSLNLSSSGLTGNISPDISNLKLIQYLDLSNNSLTGSLPDSLSQLDSLMILNLEGNKLSGSIPAILIEKSRNGSLILRVGENPNICTSGPCHKRNKVVIPLVVSFGGAFILLAVPLFIFRRRRQGIANLKKTSSCNSNDYKSMDSKKKEFTYSEVVSITNNFEKVVGKGGFGTVYHGCIGEMQVAVKMLSPSAQGYQQFQAEAKILTRVHHKCLTPLIGYCNEEGTQTALICEYMVNGNLAQNLSGSSLVMERILWERKNGEEERVYRAHSNKCQNCLTWRQRLQIALDAAIGLEYLHNGCKPPIVHRDVKSSNILLNERFRGKISDFGLSRIFPDESDTHVSTVIAGTPGYLDPEYYITNRLNEKSDIFSFGVVLLEIITGRPAISKTNEKPHVIQWVSYWLAEGEFDSIVDSRLKGEFDTESARKGIDIAMACVAPSSVNRPTMSHVVKELMQCLPLETLGNTFSGSNEIVSMAEISGESSLLR